MSCSRTSIPTQRPLANWWSRAGTRRRLPAEEVAALIAGNANITILDVRRFDEYATMNIPGSVSVPGAELVLRAGRAAPDPETTIIVNCAGRTRSIIGTQSLINAGVTNKVVALRNGTIGWTLASQNLEHGADRRGAIGPFEGAEANARDVAYRAGVRHVGMEEARRCRRRPTARCIASTFATAEEYAAGHLAGFRHYAGGQLVQEIDMAAPVRGARILLTDNRRVRADMTASWLAQMGWETYVLEGGYDGALEVGPPQVCQSPIRRTATAAPTRAPMSRKARCRPISTGNTASSNSSAATRRMDFS